MRLRYVVHIVAVLHTILDCFTWSREGNLFSVQLQYWFGPPHTMHHIQDITISLTHPSWIIFLVVEGSCHLTGVHIIQPDLPTPSTADSLHLCVLHSYWLQVHILMFTQLPSVLVFSSILWSWSGFIR